MKILANMLGQSQRGISILVFVFSMLVSFDVFAQVANPGGSGGDSFGFAATGTLVASSMETVGYHAQGQILSNLSSELADVGALIYLGVLFSMILTASLMGEYRAALWVLVGPPLFVFASGIELGGQSQRIQSSGPEWKFGAFSDPGGFREQLIKGRAPQAEVSFLFHKYNELISEISQDIINRLTAGDTERQFLFMARQRVMEDLFGTELTEPSLRALMQEFLVSCSSELTYARQVGQGLRDPKYRQSVDYQYASDKYCELFPIHNKEIINASTREYVRSIMQGKEGGDQLEFDSVSCHDMWKWIKIGSEIAVQSQTEEIVDGNVPEEAFVVSGTRISEKIKDDILRKIVSTGETSGSDPCPMMGASAGDALSELFGGLLLRKEIQNGPDASGLRRILAGDYSGTSPYEEEFQMRSSSPVANIDSIRKKKSHQMAEGRRYEAFSFIMLLPYLQGILLYTLSVLYPFFAMLLLVPGQAGSFLSWLALWAWVKSWDIGWAGLMLVDELLWELMPKSTYHNLAASGETTPASLMETHFSGDYAYSTTMYWLLLSSLVGLVPVITAEAILGAKRSIANTVVGGITDIASKLSAGAESYHSVKGLGEDLQRAEGQQMIPRIEGMLGMTNQVRGMLANIDRSQGQTGLSQTLSAPAQNFKDLMGNMGIGGSGNAASSGSGGASGAAGSSGNSGSSGNDRKSRYAEASKAHEARQNIGNALSSGLEPGQIANDSAVRSDMSSMMKNYGLDSEGLAAAGVEDPEIQAKLLEGFMTNAVAQRMYGHYLMETGDSKIAWNAAIGAIGALRGGDLKNIGKRAVDSAMDSRESGVGIIRNSSSAARWYLESFSGQSLWERGLTPEYFERESIRAFLSDNRREWFSYVDPLTHIDSNLAQEVFSNQYEREGVTKDLMYKDLRAYWDQFNNVWHKHNAPVSTNPARK